MPRGVDRARAARHRPRGARRVRAPCVPNGRVRCTRPRPACAQCPRRRSRSTCSNGTSRCGVILLFPAPRGSDLDLQQLPHPGVEARPARGRDRAAAAIDDLRQTLRPSRCARVCRPSTYPATRREPDDDRPLLRRPRPRRTRRTDGLLDAYTGARAAPVHGWTPRGRRNGDRRAVRKRKQHPKQEEI